MSSGQNKIDEVLNAGKIEVENILNMDEAKINTAVELITKKVVGINGNN